VKCPNRQPAQGVRILIAASGIKRALAGEFGVNSSLTARVLSFMEAHEILTYEPEE